MLGVSWLDYSTRIPGWLPDRAPRGSEGPGLVVAIVELIHPNLEVCSSSPSLWWDLGLSPSWSPIDGMVFEFRFPRKHEL